jgi:hypothetical protein
MSKISHTLPSYHGNITHWTYRDEMKWSSSSGFLGMLATNKLGFGFALAENSNLPNLFFGQRQCQEGMACPISATHSLHSMVTSLIGPIYGGNEMVQQHLFSLVCWLQTSLVLALLWLKSQICPTYFLASDSMPRGHGMSKISHTQPS